MAGIYRVQSGRGWRYGIDYTDALGRRDRRIVKDERGNSTRAIALTALGNALAKAGVGETVERGRNGLLLGALRSVEDYATLALDGRSTLTDVWFTMRAAKSSINADRHRWLWILRFFRADARIDRLTDLDILRFQAWLIAQPTRLGSAMTQAAANRVLSLFRGALNLAVRRKLIASNPINRDVPFFAEARRDRVCTEAELDLILGDIDDRIAKDKSRKRSWENLRVAVVLAIETGARIGEICRMRHADIDYAASAVRIPITKTRKPRTIALSKAALEVIAKRTRDKPFVGSTPSTMSTRFSEVVRYVGIQNLRLHDMRHVWATNARRAGVDLQTIKDALGHESWATMSRYQTVDVEDQHVALRKIAARRESNRTRVRADARARSKPKPI